MTVRLLNKWTLFSGQQCFNGPVGSFETLHSSAQYLKWAENIRVSTRLTAFNAATSVWLPASTAIYGVFSLLNVRSCSSSDML